MANEKIFSTPTAGGRVYLERLSAEKHLADFHELWTDPVSVKWTSFAPHTSLQDSISFMHKIVLPNPEWPRIDKFAIMLPSTGGGVGEDGKERQGGRDKMIGFVGTNRYQEQGMEVGYCMNMQYWGQGYATEGLRTFLGIYWGLPDRKDVNRLVAKTSPGNLASQRILQKCGARKGEVLENAYARYADGGEKSDVWCFYLDRPGFGPGGEGDGEGGVDGNKGKGKDGKDGV